MTINRVVIDTKRLSTSGEELKAFAALHEHYPGQSASGNPTRAAADQQLPHVQNHKRSYQWGCATPLPIDSKIWTGSTISNPIPSLCASPAYILRTNSLYVVDLQKPVTSSDNPTHWIYCVHVKQPPPCCMTQPHQWFGQFLNLDWSAHLSYF